jgi:hypothetical protein
MIGREQFDAMRSLATPGTVIRVFGQKELVDNNTEQGGSARFRIVASELIIVQAKPVFEVMKRILGLNQVT